jgi:predicted secreted protein
MQLISWFAVYFVLWWLCLFVVLPFGVRNQIDDGTVVRGTDPGAPVLPRLWRKLLVTTLLAGVVLALVMWGLSSSALQEYWR